MAATPAFGQIQVDLRTQARDVDFTQATFTRPLKTGTVLPSTCGLGDLFFKSNAPAGQNLYGCVSANTWTLQSGGAGGGAAVASQLGDFALSNTSTTVLTIGTNCSPATPCNYTDNNVLALALTGPCSVTLSGTSSTGIGYVFVSSGGVLTVGHDSAATLTPNANCSVVTAVTSFPDGSKPIAAPTFTNNAWDTVTAAMDMRGFLAANVIVPGTGIATSVNGSTGLKTVSTDSTIIPQYVTGSGAPAGNCTAGRDFYTDTTNGNLYFCKTANTWQQANGGGGGSLPSMSGNQGKMLSTDGTSALWMAEGDLKHLAYSDHTWFVGNPGTSRIFGYYAFNGSGGAIDPDGSYDASGMTPGAPYTQAATVNSSAGMRLDFGNYRIPAIYNTTQTWEVQLRFIADIQTSQTQNAAGYEDSAGHLMGIRYSNSSGCTSNGSDATWMYVPGTASAVSSGLSFAATQSVVLKMRGTGTAGSVAFSYSTDGGATYSSETMATVTGMSGGLRLVYRVTACDTNNHRMAWMYHGIDLWR